MLLKYIFLFLVGIVFGSFISVLSWRIPRSLSFIKGRSICPKCRKQIKWFDNIPLLSYLFLGGKCSNCKNHISLRYPLIEFLSGICFVLIHYFINLQDVFNIFQLVFVLTIFVILLTIFVIDLEHQIIPDSLVFVGIGLVLIYSLLIIHNSIFTLLFPGFLAASFLMIIHLLTKGRGMGLGDVKFAVLGGMIVGLKLLPVWLLISFVLGGVAGIFLMIFKKAKLKTKIAFGPFLILGIGLALLFGHNIMNILGFV